MAFEGTEEQAVLLGDEFVADEILVRLPARCAVRCIALSKRFSQLLTSPHFWLRQRHLGAPLELPHAARIQRHDDRDRKAFYFQFHVVGPNFVMEHTVSVEDRTFDSSTCNGLVLVSGTSRPDDGESSVEGVVFNPATKEEARLSLQLPHPRKENMYHSILGFGYGPSSKVYKALITEFCEVEGGSTRLMAVSLDGSGGKEPRTVFASDDGLECDHSLHTADGKVYFLMYARKLFVDSEEACVLGFDVDDEAVTRIPTPKGHAIPQTMMLEVRGRPCIYTHKGQDTVIWLLTADHRWEQLYNLVRCKPIMERRWCADYLLQRPWCDDYLLGSWDCGDGLLFVKFSTSGACLYNLHDAAGKHKEGGGCGTRRLAAVSTLELNYKQPSSFPPKNLWDYQPTLISPASIFGDAAFSGSGRQSVAAKHELDGAFLEMTHKLVVDPMMHMLSAKSNQRPRR